ncbi:hypothetical protein ES702_06534 [subsurface metagenome]
MPTTLGPKYTIDWKGTPPHMLKIDVPVWWRFLEKYSKGILWIYYDCLLGGPYLSPEEEKDPLKKMWRASTSKRADSIAELENEVWIIEVASDPGLRALGQVQTYRALWLRDPIIMKIEKMVLVCDRIDPDLLDAAGMQGVLVFIV